MYLRRHGRKKGGCDYESWTLVESVRTARGPRQRIVATVGKLPGIEQEERVGWEEIARILDGKPHPHPSLFDQEAVIPAWAEINLKGVAVERLRQFGDVYLGLALWKRLGLERFAETCMPPGREAVPWSVMAAVLVLARFCAPSSEWQIADSWYAKTALEDLVGVAAEQINDDRLYRALDALLPHKEALCQHLQQRYGELFGATFEFLFYDITSAYFEGSEAHNPMAQRGYSRDGRPDCVQVCIGLVVSRDGLPLAFEVFDGNRPDVTTVQEMVESMEAKYGQAQRVWVMDRGMVSEENLASLRARHARYLVGTPKSMLKRYEREMTDTGWEAVAPGVTVKRCATPDGDEDTFMLCRSEGRQAKERAILNRFVERMEQALHKLIVQADQGKLRDRQMVERRIGRLLERNSRVASLFSISVEETGSGKQARLKIEVHRDEQRYAWALQTGGSYLLRTNWTEGTPAQLWETYIRLTQAEDAFRITRSDLGIRPIYHQRADRTHAHILVCFLALAMWRTLQH